MGDLDFLLLWSSCSTEFFSQLEMSRAWVCVEWIEGAQTRNLWTLWSWNISNFRILLVELCRRMPPRKKPELALLVLKAFPALAGSTVDMLTTAESMVQTKLLEGPKRVFEIHENQNLPPQLLPMHLSTSYPKAAVLAAYKKSVYIQVLVNRAMDTWPISCPWSIYCPGSYRIKPLHNSIDDIMKHCHVRFPGCRIFLFGTKTAGFSGLYILKKQTMRQDTTAFQRILSLSTGVSAWTLSRLGKHMAKRRKFQWIW